MSKKLFLAMFAAVALIVSACEEKDGPFNGDEAVTNADLVATWEGQDNCSLVFKADGTFTQSRWGESIDGTWSLSDGKLSFTTKGSEPWYAGAVLTGGKAWLALVYESEDPEYPMRSFENYRKKGATVQSAALTDGRWDAPRDGIKPAKNDKNTSYTFCMIVKGKTVDLYVPAWGYHIQGTFTLEDGKMHIEADDDHIWSGNYIFRDSDGGSIGWSAWGPPDDENKPETWDDSYGSMNAETFELQAPYRYYTVNELKAMGRKPVKPEDDFDFDCRIYTWAEGIHDNCQDLMNFDLCVAGNGTEAYGGAVGLSPWLYKR